MQNEELYKALLFQTEGSAFCKFRIQNSEFRMQNCTRYCFSQKKQYFLTLSTYITNPLPLPQPFSKAASFFIQHSELNYILLPLTEHSPRQPHSAFFIQHSELNYILLPLTEHSPRQPHSAFFIQHSELNYILLPLTEHSPRQPHSAFFILHSELTYISPFSRHSPR